MAWLVIAITILAATGNSIGKVLQKQAARNLPRLSLKPDVICQFAHNKYWVIGTGSDLAGGLLVRTHVMQMPSYGRKSYS